MADFDLTNDMMADAVREVEAESVRHEYRDGKWRGNYDKNGHWTLAANADPAMQQQLDSRVLARYMEKQREAAAQQEEARREQERRAAAAEQDAQQQREFATAAAGGGGGGGGGADDGSGGTVRPRFPAGHPRAGQFRPLTPEERAARATAGGGDGGGGLPWGGGAAGGRMPGAAVGGFVGSVLGAGAGVFSAGLGMAMAPFGGAGQGATQVGSAVVGLLVTSLRSLASMGSSVLTLALGGLIAGALAGAGAVVLATVGDLFGQVAEAITSSVQGVVTIIKDVFRDAGAYAQSTMQMVYMGGQTVGEASGAISTFGAFGMSPADTAGVFGQWSMRPEFLEARLAPLGGLRRDEGGSIDWAGTLRGMRDALGQYPEMAQAPVLSSLLGQGAQQFMPMMRMEQGAFDRALGMAEALEPQSARLRELTEQLAPLQAQVSMLASVLKTELASAALEPVLGLLRTLLDLVGENRDAIGDWMADLPERLGEWLIEATHYAERFTDALPGIARGLRDVAASVAEVYAGVRSVGDFISDHPTLSAVLGGAAVGGLKGGWGGALVGGLMGGGIQVGGSRMGVEGGIGGGVAGLLAGGAALRWGPRALAGIGTRLAGPSTLAFGGQSLLGAGGMGSLLTTGGGVASAGGGLATAASLVPLLTAIAVAVTATAAWTSGWWGAYKQEKQSERDLAEARKLAIEAGFLEPYDIVRREYGELTAEKWDNNELPPALAKRVGERIQEVMVNAGKDGGDREGWWDRFRETLQGLMGQLAENTRPERVQEAHRRAAEAAALRVEGEVVYRPDRRFEEILEVEVVQQNWRAIQQALG